MKVVITAGGSVGHVYPALEVALALGKLGHEVDFVGAVGQWTDLIRSRQLTLHELEAEGFSVKRLFVCVPAMVQSIGQAKKILKDIQPACVIGFGGYGAFPVMMAAYWLHIPTLIHEQNVRPGKANRVLAPFTQKIAISFQESQKYFRSSKTVLTGCPAHPRANGTSQEHLYTKFGLMPGCSTILVLGGSQGSHHINQAFLKAVGVIQRQHDIQVIHITGRSDLAGVKEQYAGVQVKAFVTDFLNDIDEAYTIADLVVARAGAVTVTEIALNAVPAVLIPYPYAGGHQKENANVLRDLDAATVVEDSRLDEPEFAEAILKILKDSPAKEQLEQQLKNVVRPQAAQNIAQEACALV